MNKRRRDMLNPKPQSCKQKSFAHCIFGHRLLFGIWCLVLVILTGGCLAIKETAKGIAGLSTKVLEEGRENGITKTFNYDYRACYNKVRDILKQGTSYIYAQDIKKHMMAIYVSEEDTTPVGIFFTEKGASITEVEVSSPSTYAKELIAQRLFSALDRSLNPGEDKKGSDTPAKISP
jgi:hypothetical protein